MRLAMIALAGVLAACSPAAGDKDPAAAPVAIDTTTPLIAPAGDGPSDAELETAVASINPLENDLRALEVAVRLPEAFEVKAGGAVMTLQVTSDLDGMVIDEKFGLVVSDTADQGFAEKLGADGFLVHRFRLDAADHARMASAQTRMQELREAAPGQNELTFDTTAATCVTAGKAAPDVYRFSVFVRSAPTVDFVSLGGDMDIARDSAGELARLWDACPA